MNTKKPLISIIIPVFNGLKYLPNCLNSIFASNYPFYEVIIIDDHSTDGTKKYLKNLQSSTTNFQNNIRLKTLFNHRNLGAAQSRNLGAAIADGAYLLFLDVDTQLTPDCLQQIVAKFQSNPKLGALQAQLDTGGHFLTPLGFPYEIEVNDQERLIFGARSAGLAIRKDLFKHIGGFDSDYLIYGEDTDLSWRVWLAGYQIIYFPSAKLHHFQKSSFTPRNLFYQGPKNSLHNILKNAPLTIIIWMVPLHILGWLFISFKLIFQARLTLAIRIYQGLVWNFVNLKKIAFKRRRISQFKTTNSLPLFGTIKPYYLIIKGLNWIKNV